MWGSPCTGHARSISQQLCTGHRPQNTSSCRMRRSPCTLRTGRHTCQSPDFWYRTHSIGLVRYLAARWCRRRPISSLGLERSFRSCRFYSGCHSNTNQISSCPILEACRFPRSTSQRRGRGRLSKHLTDLDHLSLAFRSGTLHSLSTVSYSGSQRCRWGLSPNYEWAGQASWSFASSEALFGFLRTRLSFLGLEFAWHPRPIIWPLNRLCKSRGRRSKSWRRKCWVRLSLSSKEYCPRSSQQRLPWSSHSIRRDR